MRSAATDTIPSLPDVQERATELLLGYCQAEYERSHPIAPAYGRLWHAIANQVRYGGKRFRPYLCQVAYTAYGGQDSAAALRMASSWELLHLGLLVHDDIIDRDYKRHGQPNVAGEYLRHYEGLSDLAERRHAAHSAALLGGDLLLTAATRLVLDTPEFTPEQRIAFSQRLLEATYEVGGGELLDSEAAFQPAVAVNPELIAEYKTASYSFIGPLLSGAALAGADESELTRLRHYGRALGIGYQLADDLLGTFGDEAATGKSVDGDLREAKRTAVLVQGLANMSVPERRRAEAILAKPVPLKPAQVNELRDLLERTDVKLHIESRLDALGTTARREVADLDISEPYQQALSQLTDVVLRREH